MKSPKWIIAFLLPLLILNLYIPYNQLSHKDRVFVDSAKLINDYKGMADARKAYQKEAVVRGLMGGVRMDLKFWCI